MKILRFFSSFLAGALAVLALPPFYIVPVLFISFPVLLRNIEKAPTLKRAFLTSWWFGFGYFVFGLYWIANSLFVDIDKFWWLVPFAVAGIPFGLAFFTGFVGMFYKFLSQKYSIGLFTRTLLFPSLWILFEMLRSQFPFGGFPWNLIGYAGLFSAEFAQVASIGGVYLLGFIIVLLSLVPLAARSKLYMVTYFTLAVGSYFVGTELLKEPEQGAEKIVRIVQPNIAQTLKWDPMETGNQYVKTLNLAKSGEIGNFDLIVWPESGVPYHLNREELVLDTLKQATPKNGITITGALRSEGLGRDEYKIWNSVYMISNKQTEAVYDKHQLVPFGEYVPFRKYLPIDKITPGALDFSAGPGHKVINVNGVKLLPLICYEVIFPQLSFSNERPDFIVNVTNDGWFGNSTGPRQHLAMSQMRAIEQGVPVLRAANTGISAVIDAKGRILDSVPYNIEAVLDYKMKASNPDKTIYGSVGDILVILLIIKTVIFGCFFSFLQRNRK